MKITRIIAVLVVLASLAVMAASASAYTRPAENPAYLRYDVASKLAKGYLAKTEYLYGTSEAKITLGKRLRRSAIDFRIRLTYRDPGATKPDYDWKTVHVIRTYGDRYAWAEIVDFQPYATGLIPPQD